MTCIDYHFDISFYVEIFACYILNWNYNTCHLFLFFFWFEIIKLVYTNKFNYLQIKIFGGEQL
jgi:hypothetical protein